jgi:xylulokinase
VQECADKLIKIKSVTEPDPALVKKYAARYELWHKLYPTLKPLYAEMEALQ